jgi:hypothetical protein
MNALLTPVCLVWSLEKLPASKTSWLWYPKWLNHLTFYSIIILFFGKIFSLNTVSIFTKAEKCMHMFGRMVICSSSTTKLAKVSNFIKVTLHDGECGVIFTWSYYEGYVEYVVSLIYSHCWCMLYIFAILFKSCHSIPDMSGAGTSGLSWNWPGDIQTFISPLPHAKY